jgi:hypothetical protein
LNQAANWVRFAQFVFTPFAGSARIAIKAMSFPHIRWGFLASSTSMGMVNRSASTVADMIGDPLFS